MKNTLTIELKLPSFIARFVPGATYTIRGKIKSPSPRVMNEILHAGYIAPAHLFCPFGTQHPQSQAWEAGRILAREGKHIDFATADVRVLRRGTVEVGGYTVSLLAGAVIERKAPQEA